MAGDTYSVKINKREGIVEIEGSDKAWVAEQLARLATVYSGGGDTQPMPSPPKEDPKPSAARDESKPRARRGRSDRAKRNPDLESKLTAEIKTKFQKYVDARPENWKSGVHQVAIIATFLLDELNWPAVSVDDIYTVYLTMGWPSPAKPSSTLENARARNGYFGGWSDGKLELSHKGENFGRSTSDPGK